MDLLDLRRHNMENDEIGESYEVVRERMKDLLISFRARFPQHFSEGSTPDMGSTKEQVMVALAELDEEFSYFSIHRDLVWGALMMRISNVVDHSVNAAWERMEIQTEYARVGDGVARATAEVMWESLIPNFPPDLESLRDLAGQVVICRLNEFYFNHPSWRTVADALADSLDPELPLFYGMAGFILLYMYIKVVDEGVEPTIVCNINQ